MLLTLNASCVRPLLSSKGKRGLSLSDLPAFTRQTLGLMGLGLPTGLLAGFDRVAIDQLRERADKAACSVLLLIESDTLPIGDPEASETAMVRMKKVLQAANFLGCSSAAFSIKAADTDAGIEHAAKRLRQVSESAEKLEVTLLIAPGPGLTAAPERLTDLIKRVGGFRIGTFPDFQTASSVKDPALYLRRLCPYASALSASTISFTDAKGTKDPGPEATNLKHEPYDLGAMVKAIGSVGYEGTLAVDYRGGGDVTLGVTRSREALQTAIDQNESKLPRDEE